MSNTPIKSESPDEFLRRNNLQGFDEGEFDQKSKSVLNRELIKSIFQPKELDGDCNDCAKQ